MPLERDLVADCLAVAKAMGVYVEPIGQRIAELEREVERLRVCGTCGFVNSRECFEGGVNAADRCYFTPSRLELAEELRDG